MSELHGKPGQGIGARVPRKEDARHLHGRGNFVSDIVMPGQREVMFLRSPIAHGNLRRITKPAGLESAVYTRADITAIRDIEAPSTLPTYKLSAQPPLAHGKVRFVGEPVAMVVAKTRADAEDIAEQIELDIEELPALAFTTIGATTSTSPSISTTISRRNRRRPRSSSPAKSISRDRRWCQWKGARSSPTGTIGPAS
jgi:aerobic carbon-monoxide dehydrogenase large subunit